MALAQATASPMQGIAGPMPGPGTGAQQPQGSPQGLPPDLIAVLKQQAAQKVQQAMQAQQAISQYAQASQGGQPGPNGQPQPPTVVQKLGLDPKLHDVASDSMEGATAQKMQHDKGIGALLQKAGVPPDPSQPQGIDAAPAPQSFADGGIVGYADGGVPDPNDWSSYSADMQPDSNDTLYEAQAKAGKRAAARDAMMQQAASADAAKQAQAAQTDAWHAGDNASFIGKLKDLLGLAPSNPNYGNEGHGKEQAARPQAPNPSQTFTGDTPQADPSAPAPQATGDTGNPPPAPQDAPKWTGTQLPGAQLAAMRASSNPEMRQAAAAYDAANPPAAGSPGSTPGGITGALTPAAGGITQPGQLPAQYQTPPPDATQQALAAYLQKTLAQDPDAGRAAYAKRFADTVGAPDTSALAAQNEDLAARKARLAPKTGIDGLLDQLTTMSQYGHPGDTSGQFGARAYAGLRDYTLDRAAQGDALQDKIYANQGAMTQAQRQFLVDQLSQGETGYKDVNADMDKAATVAGKLGEANTHSSAQILSAQLAADPRYLAAQAALEKANAMQGKAGDTAKRDALNALVKMETEIITAAKPGAAMMDPEAQKTIALHTARLADYSKQMADAYGIQTLPSAAPAAPTITGAPTGKVLTLK